MAELKRADLSVRAERAILLHTILRKDRNNEGKITSVSNGTLEVTVGGGDDNKVR